jgi:hypothetical protein
MPPTITPQDFVRKWRGIEATERAASQSHFNDLCALLGELNPFDADPQQASYAFERGATKTGGPTGTGQGWADVWKRGAFAWEYKGRGVSIQYPAS